MSKRRKVGPTFTSYPAKRIQESGKDYMLKLFFFVVGSILWTGIFMVGCGVVSFMIHQFGKGGSPLDKPVSFEQVFNSNIATWVLIISYILLFIYIIRSNIDKKNNTQSSHRSVRAQ